MYWSLYEKELKASALYEQRQISLQLGHIEQSRAADGEWNNNSFVRFKFLAVEKCSSKNAKFELKTPISGENIGEKLEF